MSETRKHGANVVRAEEMDSGFRYEVGSHPGAERLMLCFQCGTCTADCPIARFNGFYKPRRIVRMVQFGLKDRLLSRDALWLCSACFTCVDHCPQGVEIASIVRALRNMVVKEKGVMPLVSKELASNLLKTGYVYSIPESRRKKREEMGLPSLPESNLEHVSKIFETTGFRKRLENAETFEKVES